MHAPGERAVVDGATACLIAVIQDAHWMRAGAGVWPPGYGLTFPIRAQLLPLEVPQFIVRVEIRGAEARAALQTHDFHSRFAELGREYPPDRAHSDDDHICFFDCHGLCPSRRAFVYCLQADHGLARERLFALQIRRREHRLRPGETDEPPAGEVLIAAV